jgi:antitoxin ParD1/3/4
MNVNLGPVFDQFVTELVGTGLYQSQSEVVREGLRLLKEREQMKQLRIAELRREIGLGAEQADRGELRPGAAVFQRLRRKSAKRRAAKA